MDIYQPWAVSPKPSAAAYAAMSWLLTGYKTAGRIDGLTGTNWGYKYADTESSDVIYAVWNYASGGTDEVTIPTGGNYTVYDIGGREVETGNGDVTLTTSEFVQYVKVEP